MTTESKQDTRTGMSPLLGALGAGAAAVLVLVLVGAVTAGRSAVVGATTGGVLTLLVFALGIAFVSLVARVMPRASLLVALLTYVLQLLVLGVCVLAIDGAGYGADTLARGWFAAGVIAVTLLWMAGHLVAATRQRIPAWDVSSSASTTGQPVAHPGGER
ncbi:hypothetical protein [Nocardioides zeicaulis]|uniref:ATP synthase protein I n=1 Tax=Nocardioides zeicaulis TaxID=1776857 RepID=A0ABV6E539_9ACTN